MKIYNYEERLYSTGSYELDELLEKAFCDGYEYALEEREFANPLIQSVLGVGNKVARQLKRGGVKGLRGAESSMNRIDKRITFGKGGRDMSKATSLTPEMQAKGEAIGYRVEAAMNKYGRLSHGDRVGIAQNFGHRGGRYGKKSSYVTKNNPGRLNFLREL